MKIISIITESTNRFFETIGGLMNFSIRFFAEVFRSPYEIEEIKKHMDELGVKTLLIVSITGFIIGLVLGMQTQPVLARFGAELFLPGTIALSVIRELGPVITALIFAGRVASGIGAELGSMRVTEQIDAMVVSAVDPFRFLVVTRVLATTLMLPLLTIYVDFIAIIGGFVAVNITQNMTFPYYISLILDVLTFTDFIQGIPKTFVFGFVIGIVGSYLGFNATKGTEGVGRASTTSVVISSILIILIDMVIVRLTLMIFPE